MTWFYPSPPAGATDLSREAFCERRRDALLADLLAAGRRPPRDSATCSVALEKSMTSTISIDPRFRGPPTSGNGGVSAGLAAAFVGESATVRIRKPPPLSAPMDVRPGRDGVEVVEGKYLILEAGPGTPAVEPPVSREILERTFERGTTAVPSGWPAPECFVCGPRADGLRICPQHLEGTELWTTVWTPDPSLSSDAETVDSHVVWGALDCPAGIAVVRVGVAEPSFFPALVELTAAIHRQVRVGESLMVVGWLIGESNKRVDGGSAVIDRDGGTVAVGYARHARLPLEFGAT